MKEIQIVILAGGLGKRMGRQDLPKVLTPFKGQPLIQHLLSAIKESGVDPQVAIVVGQMSEKVKAALGSEYIYILQPEQLGTGHAVAVTKTALRRKAKNIMVLNGDHPLVSAATIKKIAQTHLAENKVLTMATTRVDDFSDWRQDFYSFGRIVRDPETNKIIGIVEKKDATPEILQLREVNPAYFCFQADWLWPHLAKLKNDNAQSEYYLTDLVDFAFKENQEIASVAIAAKEALGINTAEELKLLEKLF